MLRREGLSRDVVPASKYRVEDDPEYDRMSAIWDKVFSDRQVTDRVWGLIEVDAGDWEEKRARRESMEDKYDIGLIPVFHLWSDPWSYLDFLLDRYDRVAASFIYVLKKDRTRGLLELFDRTDGSDVWLHLLAFSPDQARSFVPHSMDSTAWQHPSRGLTPVPGTLWSDQYLDGMNPGYKHRRGTQDYRMVIKMSLEAWSCRERMLRRFDAQRTALDRWTTDDGMLLQG